MLSLPPELKKKIRWFTVNGRHYYCAAYCEKHGYLKGKIRIRKTQDDKVFVVKTMRFITEEEMETLREKRAKLKREDDLFVILPTAFLLFSLSFFCCRIFLLQRQFCFSDTW